MSLTRWTIARRQGFAIGGVQRDAPFTMISATAYFSYLGLVKYPFTPAHLFARVTTGGTGGQTAEVGFFSTPDAPNKGNQTLTKIVVSTTMDDLTTTGRKGNPSPFATIIPAGTHLWGGMRTAMATTQPAVGNLVGDAGTGEVLITASATAFGSASTWAGVLPTLQNFTTGTAVALHWTLD